VSRSAPIPESAPKLGVALENVEKRFGAQTALRRLSLEITPGEFALLVGHNGSGKTTLLRMVASLLKPSQGRVRYTGPAAAHSWLVREHIGLVAHHTLLYDELTAQENLRFFAQLYGLPHPARRSAELLEVAGLTSRAGDLVRTFSRGMRQRLAIARALLAGPWLLLLDEPASGLDREGAAWLARTLGGLREEKCTVLMASHGASEAVEFATRAIVIRGGAVFADSAAGGDMRAILDAEMVARSAQLLPLATT
jgi:heme exporter protein A